MSNFWAEEHRRWLDDIAEGIEKAKNGFIDENNKGGRRMNKIYLAGRYSRRAELAEYAAILRKMGPMGSEITATWLKGVHEADDKTPTDYQKTQWAAQDLADIRRSDLFLAFTDNVPGRGGRHFECGYAMAIRIPIIVIGEREDNIFYAGLKQMRERYHNFSEFLNDNWHGLMRGKEKQ